MDNDNRYLKKRLNAARKRAAYWSGRPSPGGFGYDPYADNGRDAGMEYEMAIGDCEYLAKIIENLTGKKPVVTDYKQKFETAFCSARFKT